MNKYNPTLRSGLLCFFVIFIVLTGFGQAKERPTIDLQKAKLFIDSLDKQFSRYYFEGDSLGLYHMYAKGATLGALKGDEILQFWGRQIRNSVKNDTRNIIYETTSLSTDGEFLAELGTFEVKNSQGNSKAKGKYLVVWKQEDGTWKLYRDMAL